MISNDSDFDAYGEDEQNADFEYAAALDSEDDIPHDDKDGGDG